MVHSRLLITAALLFAVISVISGMAALRFASDPSGSAETIATAFLHRPVTFRSFAIVSFNPLSITADGVKVKNRDWGTRPEILEIGRLSALIDFWPLLHGDFRILKMDIAEATLFLEHNPDGTGNWKGTGPPGPSRSPEERAKNSRLGLPTMLNLHMTDTQIIFRTTGGALLKIYFGDFLLDTADERTPVNLKVNGSYNDIPTKLDIKAGSFEELRTVDKPFHADVLADAADTDVILKADMMDPLNFDLVEADLDVKVKRIGRMAALFGNPFSWDVPIDFDGTLKRHEDVWNIGEGHGVLDRKDRFEKSSLLLKEGARKQPDFLKVSLNFEDIDVDALLKSRKDPNQKTASSKLLDVDPNPSTLLDAHVTATEVTYHHVTPTKVSVEAVIEKNRLAFPHVDMAIFGGRIEAALSAAGQKEATGLTIKGKIKDVDLSELMATSGQPPSLIAGEIDGDIALEAKGDELATLEQTMKGSVLLTMEDGKISRHVMRLASANIEALLDRKAPMSDVNCMAAVLNFKDGVGTLAPFRFKTSDGTLEGKGHLSLASDDIDLWFQTDPKSTSPLALDLPIHVTGRLTNAEFLPTLGSVSFEEPEALALPPGVSWKAKESPCL